MSVLLDTNILGRLAQPTHRHHVLTQQALVALRQRDPKRCIVPQNLYEFWVVCTRPAGSANGLGLTVEQTQTQIAMAKSLFMLLPDSPPILVAWERLVIDFSVKGKPSHDARLVAAMKVHGIGQILTFNVSDFTRYPGIEVLDPRTIIAG